MTDPDHPVDEQHPVVFGLLALVGVGIVVGLVAGVAALAGAHVLGVGGGSSSSSTSVQKTMYLPKYQPTKGPSGPEITLAPGETPSGDSSSEPSQPESSKSPKKQISLQVGENTVQPMQNIDLTGVYPGGEGAILRVQRLESGQWTDFYSVTASVSNQTFSTYVQTSASGLNKFRVVDTDTGLTSNVVRVTVS